MKIALRAHAQTSFLIALAAVSLLLAGCETPTGGGAGGAASIETLRSAAEGGDAAAAYKLGEAYFHGRGVPKNFVEADTWYKKAAELYQKK
jgi:TPR repeat protein